MAKERTTQLAAAEAEAAEARGSDGEGEADGHDGGADGKSAATSRPAGLPASIVKRIMSLDEDVDRCLRPRCESLAMSGKLLCCSPPWQMGHLSQQTAP